MPKCIKCENTFPNLVQIDGKTRNLCKRKLCLDCSPFKSGKNKLFYNEFVRKVKQCTRCGKEHTQNANMCPSCYSVQRRIDIKTRAVEYKGGKCILCGYQRCTDSLVFHHINPEEKSFAISGTYLRSWEKIKEELDKCVLLCANCHGEVHAGFVEVS